MFGETGNLEFGWEVKARKLMSKHAKVCAFLINFDENVYEKHVQINKENKGIRLLSSIVQLLK